MDEYDMDNIDMDLGSEIDVDDWDTVTSTPSSSPSLLRPVYSPVSPTPTLEVEDVESEEDDNELSPLKRTRKALMTDLILVEIFSNLQLEDLKACKLVCDKWKEQANTQIRKIKTLDFMTGRNSVVKIKKFINDFSNSRNDIPFEKFSFPIYGVEPFHFKSLPTLSKDFFSLVGPFLKKLHLDYKDFMITVNHNMSWIVGAVPNIKTLEIRKFPCHLIDNTERKRILKMGSLNLEDNVFRNLETLQIVAGVDGFPRPIQFLQNIITDEDIPAQTRVLTDILWMCPNLRSFGLETTYESDRTDFKPSYIPATASALKNMHSFAKLTHLSLKCKLNDDDLIKIHQTQFKLLSLEILKLDVDVTKQTLEDLLLSQRQTLQKLTLGEDTNVTQIKFKLAFPIMSRLANLTIIRESSEKNCRKMTFLFGTYSQTLKKLKTLDLSQVRGGVQDFLPDTKTRIGARLHKNRSVQKIRLPICLKEESVMKRIFLLFPNLRSLFVNSPRTEILKVIWKFGQNLEELEIIDIDIAKANMVFSGVPQEVCEWIENSESYSRLNQNFFKVVQREKSLCSLLKLQKLTLKFRSKCEIPHFIGCGGGFHITDVMARLSLSKMKSLISLTIRNGEFSDECKERLKEKSRIQYFNFENDASNSAWMDDSLFIHTDDSDEMGSDNWSDDDW